MCVKVKWTDQVDFGLFSSLSSYKRDKKTHKIVENRPKFFAQKLISSWKSFSMLLVHLNLVCTYLEKKKKGKSLVFIVKNQNSFITISKKFHFYPKNLLKNSVSQQFFEFLKFHVLINEYFSKLLEKFPTKKHFCLKGQASRTTMRVHLNLIER